MRSAIGVGLLFLLGCGASSPAARPECAVPTTGEALLPWLRAKNYAQFAAESAVHSSGGPHGKVRTFLSSELEASLAAGKAEHPVCAAAVKELYAADGATLTGWAVEVKIASQSQEGKGWYWYEVVSTAQDAKPVADGDGVRGCVGCHSAGKDYVTTPYPLR